MVCVAFDIVQPPVKGSGEGELWSITIEPMRCIMKDVHLDSLVIEVIVMTCMDGR